MRTPILTCTVIGLLSLVTVAPAFGQSFQERLEHVRRQREAERRQAVTEANPPGQPSVRQRLATVIESVSFEEVPARQALAWWSQRTGVSLVINWAALEAEGVFPDTPITLELERIPSTQLLSVLLRLTAGDVELIHEVTPWYVQIQTRREANRVRVTRLYDISAIVMPVPDFQGPEFDLESALESGQQRGSGQGVGGSSSGGRGGLFSQDTDRDEQPPTRTERAEQIAEMIRNSVQPDVWVEHGGESTIRYFQGNLVINAPLYVHRQIGTPTSSSRNAADAARSDRQRIAPQRGNERRSAPNYHAPGNPARPAGTMPAR